MFYKFTQVFNQNISFHYTFYQFYYFLFTRINYNHYFLLIVGSMSIPVQNLASSFTGKLVSGTSFEQNNMRSINKSTIFVFPQALIIIDIVIKIQDYNSRYGSSKSFSLKLFSHYFLTPSSTNKDELGSLFSSSFDHTQHFSLTISTHS